MICRVIYDCNGYTAVESANFEATFWNWFKNKRDNTKKLRSFDSINCGGYSEVWLASFGVSCDCKQAGNYEEVQSETFGASVKYFLHDHWLRIEGKTYFRLR